VDTPAAVAAGSNRLEADNPAVAEESPAAEGDIPVAGVDTLAVAAAGSNRLEAGKRAVEGDRRAAGVDTPAVARLRPVWCRTAGKRWFPGLPACRSSDRRKQEEYRRHYKISGLPNSARRIAGILSTVAYYSPYHPRNCLHD
jgi:hypothetical protein